MRVEIISCNFETDEITVKIIDADYRVGAGEYELIPTKK